MNNIYTNTENKNNHGFICYLFRNSSMIRNMIISEMMNSENPVSTEIAGEAEGSTRDFQDYHLIINDNPDSERFTFNILEPDPKEGFLEFMVLNDRKKESIGGIEAVRKNFLYILSDCEADGFVSYRIFDADIRKNIKLNRETFSITEENILETHLSYNTDRIGEASMNTDMDHFIYMIRYGIAYDEQHPFWKEISRCHNDYLSSEDFRKDREYEIQKEHENSEEEEM